MATVHFSDITARGTLALFNESMEQAPQVWRKHCQVIPSDAKDEKHVWMGMFPVPREFTSGRNLQGVRDFSFTLTNKVYELSFVFDRDTYADDRHGQIKQRLKEISEVWARFHDSLFAALLTAGETSTDTFDGISFHNGTRTIGASANIDNTGTAAITLNTDPSTSDVLDALQTITTHMARYEDDQAQAGYNTQAMQKLAVIIPPEFKRAFTEAINSTVISQSDNPWGNQLVDFDVLPHLATSDVAFYTSALGSVRKPFIYQDREPLEINVYNGGNDIALNNGLLVLCRQRFVFGYGEPRRSYRWDYTTA